MEYVENRRFLNAVVGFVVVHFRVFVNMPTAAIKFCSIAALYMGFVEVVRYEVFVSFELT